MRDLFIFLYNYLFILKLECVWGYFGMDCREFCGGYCESNELCDYVSGVCFDGC